MGNGAQRSTTAKIALFERHFTGLRNVFGTYDLKTGKVRQVKAPVTREVLFQHLKGNQPFGVYLLDGSRTRAVVLDFDKEDTGPPLQCIAAAQRFGLHAYIERSKSKGYHVWIFFEPGGVEAWKARQIARRILEEIAAPATEVFPKQDRLDGQVSFGNFINAPLFGGLVPQGRTVFLNPETKLAPHSDQWEFLEKIQCVSEQMLNKLLDQYKLAHPEPQESVPTLQASSKDGRPTFTFGLPPCARQMLEVGVTQNQRVACFRLAAQLKKAGLPQDLALATLKAWSKKNKPDNGNGVISEGEIVAQISYAYRRNYLACGCEDPTVIPYCDPRCIIGKKHPTPK